METPRERWEIISYQWRLVGTLAVFIFLGGVALYLRPDHELARYWQATLQIRGDAMALLYVASALILPLIYYLWRQLIYLSLAIMPVIVTLALVAWRVLTTSQQSLLYAWMPLVIIAFVVILFHFSSEVQSHERALTKVVAECEDLRKKLTAAASAEE